MSPVNRLLVFIILSVVLQQQASSQNLTGSPYSRYGIGELNSGTFARNLGMGGIETAIQQAASVNPGNPASFSVLAYTTYEGGLSYNQYELSTASRKQYTNTISLAYFAFAFPVKAQKMGLGFGLSPYSDVGYSVDQQFVTPTGGAESHNYSGSGGLNQFYLAAGYSPFKGFSFGVKADYLFGVINQTRTVEFTETAYFNTRLQNNASVGWFNFNFGLQYRLDSLPVAPSDSMTMISRKIKMLNDSLDNHVKESDGKSYEQLNSLRSEIANAEEVKRNIVTRKKKSDWHLLFGITASPATDLRSKQNVLAENYKKSTLGNIIVRDTIQHLENNEGIVRLPLRGSFGISLRNGTKWLIGADFSVQQWNDFSFFSQTDSLTDSWRASLGGQLIPNDRAVNSYWQMVHYRLGAYYGKTFLNLRGNQLNDMGLTLGLGFPIRRAGTVLNLSVAGGERGTVENNLIRERYLKFTLGFTINDRWFLKPKLD